MRYTTIFKGQVRSLFRDPMALFMSFIPLILYFIVKFGIPALSLYVDKWVDLVPHYAFIHLIFYMMTPTMLGIVLGLLLMDERDMDVLSFIDITPFKLSNYIIFKSVIGCLIGFFVNLLLALFIGDGITLNIIFTLLLASLLVPFFAFFIFAFSKNKVEGLTFGKLSTFVIIGAIVPYFSDSVFVNLLGVLPSFWIYKIFYSENQVLSLIFFLIGITVTLIYIWLLKVKSKMSI